MLKKADGRLQSSGRMERLSFPEAKHLMLNLVVVFGVRLGL
jgi:hypothetical protein